MHNMKFAQALVAFKDELCMEEKRLQAEFSKLTLSLLDRGTVPDSEAHRAAVSVYSLTRMEIKINAVQNAIEALEEEL